MNYFEQCLGAGYTPVMYGANEGVHPQRVREAIQALQGTPQADVIAALVHRCELQQLWLERARASEIAAGSPASEDDRLLMAAEGWHSEDRLTDMGWGNGRMGYSIWFWRNDWHGKKTHQLTGGRACYHAHTADLRMIPQTIGTAAGIARRAWAQFPEVPPRQGLGDALFSNEALVRQLEQMCTSPGAQAGGAGSSMCSEDKPVEASSEHARGPSP